MPGTRTRGGSAERISSMKARSGPSYRSRWRVTIARPLCQVVSTVNTTTPMSSGSQAPETSLVRLAAKKSPSTTSRAPPPATTSQSGARQRLPREVEEQQRRDRDRAGHGHAEGEGEGDRGLEGEDQQEHRDHQHPVDVRHVDLADGLPRRVPDPQARQVSELHGLMGHGEGPGDDGLRGDHRRRRGQEDERQLRPPGRQEEERALDAAGGVAQDERALAEVAQDARREDQRQPRAGDRAAAEVAHVGVQGLGPGDGEHDGGQGEERDGRVVER